MKISHFSSFYFSDLLFPVKDDNYHKEQLGHEDVITFIESWIGKNTTNTQWKGNKKALVQETALQNCIGLLWYQKWHFYCSKSKTMFYFIWEVQYSSIVSLRTIIYRTRAPRGTDRSPEYNEYFCYKWPILPCPGSAPGQIWTKHLYACARPWALHPYQVS